MTEPLDAALRTILGREDSPAGAAIAVATRGRTVTAVAGARQLAGTEPGVDADEEMTLLTEHDLASITKAITTTVILRLVSDGSLSLDDTAHRLLPSVQAAGGATVRDLLQHRAGLWEWWPLYLAASGHDEAFAYLDRMPLRYAPCTTRHYSDLGFMLLGRIVEQVTGQPLDQAVVGLVLDPLGMSSTRYSAPVGHEVAASSFGDSAEMRMIETGVPYPVPYSVDDFAGWRRHPIVGEVNDGNAFHALGGISGHAGLFSSVGDLLLLGTALSSDSDLWSPTVAEEFFREGPDAGQALGFRRYGIALDGETMAVIGHPGYTGSVLGFLPGRATAIVMATNRLHMHAVPVPAESMWSTALRAAADVIS